MKSHIHAHDGDSFADTLAAADSAAATEEQPATAPAKPPAKTGAAAPDADIEDTDTDDTGDAPVTASMIAAASSSPVAKPQLPASADKHADGKEADGKDKVKPQEAQPANDNNAAQVLQQPVPVPPVTAKAAPPDDSAAPVGTAQPASPQQAAPQQTAPQQTAPQQATHDADSSESGDSAEEIAAAPPFGNGPPNPAAAKSGNGVKKVADGAKPAAAKPDAAQNKSADAGSDAKKAEISKADTSKADNSQADAKAAAANQAGVDPAHAPAPVSQPNGPQDAMPPAAAPAGASTATAAMPAPGAAAPLPHHAPNLTGLAVTIAAKSQGGAKQFDIRLDPPELGRVDVRLAIDANGKTQAHLTADLPHTLDLLQKDASSLTRALRDAGLDVSQDGLNFSLRDQQQQQTGHDQGRAQGGRTWRGSFAPPTPIETANATGAYSARGRGLLDIKV